MRWVTLPEVRNVDDFDVQLQPSGHELVQVMSEGRGLNRLTAERVGRINQAGRGDPDGYQDRKYFFQSRALLDDETKRLLVIEPSEKQLRDEEHGIALYVAKVNPTSNYVYIDIPVKSNCSQRSFQDYYAAYEKRRKPDLSNNSVVGWFEFRSTEELCFAMEDKPHWKQPNSV